jgi:DNA-directed RNA polymerase specialized sigma24 family protein
MTMQTEAAPAWVQADRAARWAWTHDKRWRQQATHVAPPVHRPLGNGGTVGDQLLLLARRDYARSAAQARAKAPSVRPDLAHADDCICPHCRKGRGEYVPTLQQQQERRKRTIQEDGSDEPGWRLSLEQRAAHMAMVDVVFEAAGLSATRSGKMNWCQLRERFIDHLDQQAHHALLTLAEARPRQARIVLCCALLNLRQVDVARQEGLTHGRISQLLHEGLAFMRACVARDGSVSVALTQDEINKSC